MGVRRLGEDDWRELRDVRLEALRTDPDAFASTLAREEAMPEDTWRSRLRGSHWFVSDAEDDDGDVRPVGLVCVYADPAGPPDERHLVAMWVRPGHRRGGHGAALVDAAVGAARDDGARVLTLWVVDGNGAAAALYASRGFRRTGERTTLARDARVTEERWDLVL